jgi:hypothetical protein
VKDESKERAGKAIPPYPLEVPEWYTAQHEKLEKKIDFEAGSGKTLSQAAHEIAEAIGSPIELKGRAKEVAEEKVEETRYKESPAGGILLSIVNRWGLQFFSTSQGIVISDDRAKYPVPRGVALNPLIKDLRVDAFRSTAEKARLRKEAEKRLREGPEWVRKIKDKMKSTKVTINQKDATFRDALKLLKDQSKLDFIIDPDLSIQDEKIGATFSSRSVKEVLDQLLTPHRLGYTFMEGFIFITTMERANQPSNLHLWPTDAEINAAARGFLEKKIGIELRGKRIYQIIAPLETAVGISFYTCPETWKSTQVISTSTVDLTLRQVLDLLKAKGIGSVIWPVSLDLPRQVERDTVFLLSKPRS